MNTIVVTFQFTDGPDSTNLTTTTKMDGATMAQQLEAAASFYSDTMIKFAGMGIKNGMRPEAMLVFIQGTVNANTEDLIAKVQERLAQ